MLFRVPKLPFRLALLAAFAAVYVIWGSTYLAIRVAVETLPPFLMSGTRFLLAGAMLYGWAARGAARPGTRAWLAAALLGALLLLGGNGGVTWAEQTVTSGMAALLVASEPLWIVLLDWLRPGGRRPGLTPVLGVALGFGGVALLLGPGALSGVAGVNLGAIVIILAASSWAVGSLYARQAPLPTNGPQSSGMQMLAGGVLLTVAGLGSGELQRLSASSLSPRGLLALAYLVVFGSIVAFSAYAWLVKHTTAARASTYAYVNPVVAVLLGWALLGEPITGRTLVAAAIIVGSVALITRAQREAHGDDVPRTATSTEPQIGGRPRVVPPSEEYA